MSKHKYKEADILNDLYVLKFSQGLTNKELLNHIQGTYGYTIQQAYNYLKKLNEDIVTVNKELRTNALEEALERLELLYKSCIQDNDKKTALNVQKEIDDLLQLKKQELTIKSDVPLINIVLNNGE